MNKRLTLIADTETVGLPPRNYIYDIAWQLVDKHGTVIEKENYLCREIITNGKLMTGAYFATKIFDFYIEKIERNEIEILPYAEIMSRMAQTAKSAHTFSAYNLPFDLKAIKSTKALLNVSGRVWDRVPDLLCLWNFACTTALNSRLYHDLAHAQNWVSEAGNVRTTAETAYRYLTGNLDFIESHTALDDVEIETVIFSRLMSRKQKVPLNDMGGLPWQKAQKIV